MKRFVTFILMLIMISSACFAAVSFPDLKIHLKDNNGNYRYTPNGEPVIEDHWATKEIVKAANIGLIEGYPDGNFMPDINITRGEFIKMYKFHCLNDFYEPYQIQYNQGHIV